jgi:hypothetical protein
MSRYKKAIKTSLDKLVPADVVAKIMQNLEPGAPLPVGEREYLTVQDFLKIADTATDIVILTKKYGEYRCHCLTPVRNLRYDFEKRILQWSDDDGDPTLNVGLDEKINDINNCGKYSTTVFRIKK